MNAFPAEVPGNGDSAALRAIDDHQLSVAACDLDGDSRDDIVIFGNLAGQGVRLYRLQGQP